MTELAAMKNDFEQKLKAAREEARISATVDRQEFHTMLSKLHEDLRSQIKNNAAR